MHDPTFGTIVLGLQSICDVKYWLLKIFAYTSLVDLSDQSNFGMMGSFCRRWISFFVKGEIVSRHGIFSQPNRCGWGGVGRVPGKETFQLSKKVSFLLFHLSEYLKGKKSQCFRSLRNSSLVLCFPCYFFFIQNVMARSIIVINKYGRWGWKNTFSLYSM